ncbi:MAG TPA: phosphoribosyltransferase [Gammaproteobacteria bacterium]|nr:phosphoribosyltransferase [Gammaproteobacteria bacterium]
MTVPIKDRNEAGRQLARALDSYRGRSDLLVLALPRGGVPVAVEVARALDAPLDLILARKLGTPGQPELAMGAVASGGAQVVNADIVAALGIADDELKAVVERETRELERREQAYRGARPRPAIAGKCVILVDDGVATGATVRAAVAALRSQQPARLVIAVPVAPPDTVERLRRDADEVICPETPEPFIAISRWYLDFPQLSDSDVRELLAQAWNNTQG